MYDMMKQGYDIYQQHKDYILIGMGVLTVLATNWQKVKTAGAIIWKGIKWCWPVGKTVELEGDSLEIVCNIMKAEAYDDEGIVYYGNLLYYPNGTIKRRHYVENRTGDGLECRLDEVPLDKHERKELKAAHKDKLAELKERKARLLRTHALLPEKHAMSLWLDGVERAKAGTSRKSKVLTLDEKGHATWKEA